MIALSLPDHGPFGWGVCGRELTAALKSITEVVGLPVDGSRYPIVLDVPTLHAIQGPTFLPLREFVWSNVRNIGYCFLEETALAARYKANAKHYFDHVVTGSTWCTEGLRQFLDMPVATIIQGISPRFFEVESRVRDDRFIVFSGGKAETRKGQDIVIKAMAVFMGRHADAFFSTAWFNPWRTPGYDEIVELRYNFLPLRHRLLGPGMAAYPHREMIAHYRDADVGLFPNRCEAGTNLVLMEAMASGMPCIATYATGHKDILVEGDFLNLTDNKPLVVQGADGQPTGVWVEPSVDECIAKLEWAYAHRDELPLLGQRARALVRPHTWDKCAREFLKILEG